MQEKFSICIKKILKVLQLVLPLVQFYTLPIIKIRALYQSQPNLSATSAQSLLIWGYLNRHWTEIER